MQRLVLCWRWHHHNRVCRIEWRYCVVRWVGVRPRNIIRMCCEVQRVRWQCIHRRMYVVDVGRGVDKRRRCWRRRAGIRGRRRYSSVIERRRTHTARGQTLRATSRVSTRLRLLHHLGLRQLHPDLATLDHCPVHRTHRRLRILGSFEEGEAVRSAHRFHALRVVEHSARRHPSELAQHRREVRVGEPDRQRGDVHVACLDRCQSNLSVRWLGRGDAFGW